MYIEAPPATDPIALDGIDLGLLCQEPTRSLFDRANDGYDFWQKFRRRPLPEGLTAEQAWRLLKFYRLTKSVYLGLPSLPGLHVVITDGLLERLHRIGSRLAGTVTFEEELTPGKEARYVRSAMMEEAIASSQLEGASTERSKAKAMLRQARAPRDNSERMIANNYAAMRFVVETSERPITPDYLLELHRIATENTLDDPAWEGSFRIGGNQVVDSDSGEVVHGAPPVERLEGLVAELCRYASEPSPRPFVHPLVRAAVLHFLVGYIHPFEDGNGRTARALMYAYMLRHGYWLTEYLVISKAIAKSRVGYDRAYLHAEHDGLDATYFVQHQLKAIQTAVQQFDEYIARKLRREREARELQVREGYNVRQADTLAQLRRDPRRVFNVQDYAREHDVTITTARTDLEALVKESRLRRSRPGRQVLYAAPSESKS